MGVGDTFNGPVATYSVCDIWKINGLSGVVNWPDGTTTSMSFDDPHIKPRIARTVKALPQVGVFRVTAQIWGTCEDQWHHNPNLPNSVIGAGSVYVYDSVPITALDVFCSGSTPCTSIVGGNEASGLVTHSYAPPHPVMGTLVTIRTQGPGYSLTPYVIEPVGQNTVPFSIQTLPVAAPTPLIISVFSGGTTVTATLTVT